MSVSQHSTQVLFLKKKKKKSFISLKPQIEIKTCNKEYGWVKTSRSPFTAFLATMFSLSVFFLDLEDFYFFLIGQLIAHPECILARVCIQKIKDHGMLCGYYLLLTGQHKLIHFCVWCSQTLNGLQSISSIRRRVCAFELFLFFVEHNLNENISTDGRCAWAACGIWVILSSVYRWWWR